jgi:GTP pyrophosphokinase
MLQVCVVVHEVQRVRAAALSLQVYDEHTASALREMCLVLSDVRAILIEVLCQLDLLQNALHLSVAKQQSLALRILQIFSPLGHALGLSVVSARMEDQALAILIPESYQSVQEWISQHRSQWLKLLTAMKADLLEASGDSETLTKLGVTVSVTVRAKSAFSTMKKLLQLSGWSPACLHMGMRVVVLALLIFADPSSIDSCLLGEAKASEPS